ncbi:hypothetical protein KTR9_1510 [Gordonia sp. KTR9]|nr:hypothetical protein KTR9_1510 [Gordonia sp. KTR9]
MPRQTLRARRSRSSHVRGQGGCAENPCSGRGAASGQAALEGLEVARECRSLAGRPVLAVDDDFTAGPSDTDGESGAYAVHGDRRSGAEGNRRGSGEVVGGGGGDAAVVGDGQCESGRAGFRTAGVRRRGLSGQRRTDGGCCARGRCGCERYRGRTCGCDDESKCCASDRLHDGTPLSRNGVVRGAIRNGRRAGWGPIARRLAIGGVPIRRRLKTCS